MVTWQQLCVEVRVGGGVGVGVEVGPFGAVVGLRMGMGPFRDIVDVQQAEEVVKGRRPTVHVPQRETPALLQRYVQPRRAEAARCTGTGCLRISRRCTAWCVTAGGISVIAAVGLCALGCTCVLHQRSSCLEHRLCEGLVVHHIALCRAGARKQ